MRDMTYVFPSLIYIQVKGEVQLKVDACDVHEMRMFCQLLQGTGHGTLGETFARME